MPEGSLPKKKFRERLAYYLMGVAIGCMLLGFAYLARQRMPQPAGPAPAAVPAPATP